MIKLEKLQNVAHILNLNTSSASIVQKNGVDVLRVPANQKALAIKTFGRVFKRTPAIKELDGSVLLG